MTEPEKYPFDSEWPRAALKQWEDGEKQKAPTVK